MTTPSDADLGQSGAEPVSRAAALALQLATAATLVLSLVGLASGRIGDIAGIAAVAVVVAAPLLRVAWLGTLWWRAGDRRYSLIAFALLGVVLGGATAAIIAT